MIVMRLSGIFRIFALAVQGIFGDGGVEQPAFAVHDRNANAQSAKVDASNNRHHAAWL